MADPTPSDLWHRLRRERFLIVGFTSRTGLSAARLFDRQGIPYRISDLRPRAELEPLLAGLSVASPEVYCGPQGPEQLEGITGILLSPGVPRDIPLVAAARQRGIPAWTDIDFLHPFIAHKQLIAITGTDGKTTTTTLTGQLLSRAGSVVVAGNIGIPVLDAYDAILDSDFAVLEISSFMLEEHRAFRANVAAILNIAEDHIDRYPDRAAYGAAKLRIDDYSTERDLFVKNLDDPLLSHFTPKRARVRTVSQRGHRADLAFRNGAFDYLGRRLPFSDCALQGRQNVENILAALAIATEYEVEPKAVAEVLREFKGVSHRCEPLGVFKGIAVYDDSKATSVQAVTAALSNFDEGVVLIVGGRDKGLDFTALRSERDRIAALVCYGEAANRLAVAIDHPSCHRVGPFAQAVEVALSLCRPGGTLLLSPGCTSWDQFSSYEERGAEFRRRVARWAEGP